MGKAFVSLVKKDLRMMAASRFVLLALLSLLGYSLYINFVYVNLEQEIYPVYLFDPEEKLKGEGMELVKDRAELEEKISDGYSLGVDASKDEAEILMISSGIAAADNFRGAYASHLLTSGKEKPALRIGEDDKEMKSRREITCEFLFFELAAVGFLGIASMVFKEKQMGMLRVYGILPVGRGGFILAKLLVLLFSDLCFAFLLTVINLRGLPGIQVLPYVLLQTMLLSLMMALLGFCFAVGLKDFRQFSLLYLVLAVFVTTPVFLAGQTGLRWDWIKFHPMYYLFGAIKRAYSGEMYGGGLYYGACGLSIALLFLTAGKILAREMSKEG